MSLFGLICIHCGTPVVDTIDLCKNCNKSYSKLCPRWANCMCFRHRKVDDLKNETDQKIYLDKVGGMTNTAVSDIVTEANGGSVSKTEPVLKLVLTPKDQISEMINHPIILTPTSGVIGKVTNLDDLNDLPPSQAKVDREAREVIGTSMPHGKFHIWARYYIVTYKYWLLKSEVIEYFARMGFKARVAHEIGTKKIDYRHSHVFLDCEKQFNSQNPRIFDNNFQLAEAEYPVGEWELRFEKGIKYSDQEHPNIGPICKKKHLNRIYAYMCKYDHDNDDMLTWIQKDTICEDIWDCPTIVEALKTAERINEIPGIVAAYNLRPTKERAERLEAEFHWQHILICQLRGLPGSKRTIHWIYDHRGGMGKSDFAKLARQEFNKDCFVMTQFGGAKDSATVIANAIDMGWSGKILIIDLPRGAEDKSIYEPMEMIKNGLLTTIKYNGKTVEFNNRWIIVLANFYPKITTMTYDRWKIWDTSVNPDYWRKTPEDFKDSAGHSEPWRRASNKAYADYKQIAIREEMESTYPLGEGDDYGSGKIIDKPYDIWDSLSPEPKGTVTLCKRCGVRNTTGLKVTNCDDCKCSCGNNLEKDENICHKCRTGINRISDFEISNKLNTKFDLNTEQYTIADLDDQLEKLLLIRNQIARNKNLQENVIYNVMEPEIPKQRTCPVCERSPVTDGFDYCRICAPKATDKNPKCQICCGNTPATIFAKDEETWFCEDCFRDLLKPAGCSCEYGPDGTICQLCRKDCDGCCQGCGKQPLKCICHPLESSSDDDDLTGPAYWLGGNPGEPSFPTFDMGTDKDLSLDKSYHISQVHICDSCEKTFTEGGYFNKVWYCNKCVIASIDADTINECHACHKIIDYDLKDSKDRITCRSCIWLNTTGLDNKFMNNS